MGKTKNEMQKLQEKNERLQKANDFLNSELRKERSEKFLIADGLKKRNKGISPPEYTDINGLYTDLLKNGFIDCDLPTFKDPTWTKILWRGTWEELTKLEQVMTNKRNWYSSLAYYFYKYTGKGNAKFISGHDMRAYSIKEHPTTLMDSIIEKYSPKA